MNPNNVRAEKIRDTDRWNRFVDSLFGGLPLHHLDFLALLTRDGNRQVVPLGIMGDGKLEAIIPLITERRGPNGIFKVAKNIDFYDGLVPQVRSTDLLTYLGLIRREAKRNLIGLARFAVYPDRPLDASSISRLRGQGYEVERASSFVIPIKGRDVSNIRKFANRRIYRNLEHAKEYGVQVRDATEQEMERTFPQLEMTAYQGTGGKFPFSPTVFGDIWRSHHNDPRFSMRTAYIRTSACEEEIVIGMALMIDNGKVANFWKCAAREGYDHMQPSTVLYWDAINISAAKGLRVIDTGGAPSPGIAEYKAQWGTFEVPYYHIRSITMPLYHVIEKMRTICDRAITWRQKPSTHAP